jgi:hypothetical protein
VALSRVVPESRSAPTQVRREQQRVLAEAKAKLARAVGHRSRRFRADIEADAVADRLLSVVSGIDMRLAAGAPADVPGLARALLTMLGG